jgi:hypothetical protein
VRYHRPAQATRTTSSTATVTGPVSKIVQKLTNTKTYSKQKDLDRLFSLLWQVKIAILSGSCDDQLIVERGVCLPPVHLSPYHLPCLGGVIQGAWAPTWNTGNAHTTLGRQDMAETRRVEQTRTGENPEKPKGQKSILKLGMQTGR